jgi:hypothetical protein
LIANVDRASVVSVHVEANGWDAPEAVVPDKWQKALSKCDVPAVAIALSQGRSLAVLFGRAIPRTYLALRCSWLSTDSRQHSRGDLSIRKSRAFSQHFPLYIAEGTPALRRRKKWPFFGQCAHIKTP